MPTGKRQRKAPIAVNQPGQAERGNPWEVFAAFLRLGLSAFGGPVAHLGYFRDEFVARRRWLGEGAYAELLALCAFLPGPTSSQVGFAIGLKRAGPLGALAAWTAFTLPSALLLTLLAFGTARFSEPFAAGALHGLKVVAFAVVAQAVWSMAPNLAPDWPRAVIAVAVALVLLAVPAAAMQPAAIALAALAGIRLCRGAANPVPDTIPVPLPRWAGFSALALFVALLVGLPIMATATGSDALGLASAFYRSGALVFGGGHVVLPLLEAELVQPGLVTAPTFLAGYSAAQAVPGPLFAFGAYLGALAQPGPGGLAGAALGLVALFLPGLLLVVGVLPFRDVIARRPSTQAAIRGVNAAVIGILAAALLGPVRVGAIDGPADLALALVDFLALVALKAPPWLVVALSALVGIGLA